MARLSSFSVLLPCLSLGLLSFSGCGGSSSSGNAPESLVGYPLAVTNQFTNWDHLQNEFSNLHVLGFNVTPLSVDTCQFSVGGTAFADPSYRQTYAYYRNSDNTGTLQLAYNAKKAQGLSWSYNVRYSYALTFNGDKTATGTCVATMTPTANADVGVNRLTLNGTATITGFPN